MAVTCEICKPQYYCTEHPSGMEIIPAQGAPFVINRSLDSCRSRLLRERVIQVNNPNELAKYPSSQPFEYYFKAYGSLIGWTSAFIDSYINQSLRLV